MPNLAVKIFPGDQSGRTAAWIAQRIAFHMALSSSLLEKKLCCRPSFINPSDRPWLIKTCLQRLATNSRSWQSILPTRNNLFKHKPILWLAGILMCGRTSENNRTILSLIFVCINLEEIRKSWINFYFEGLRGHCQARKANVDNGAFLPIEQFYRFLLSIIQFSWVPK